MKYLRRLSGTALDGRVFLFTGPPGVGKTTAALALAAARLSPAPNAYAAGFDFGQADPGPSTGPEEEVENASACGRCPACAKLLAGSHQDFILLEPLEDKKTISIEQARELIKTLRFAPQESDQRLVVIPQAERLTLEAANALLKTLEEPPAHTCLILTTAEPEALPGTIRSRCQAIAFKPLSRELVKELVMARTGQDEAAAARAADLSGGSLGLALSLDGPAATARRDELLERLAALSAARTARLVDLAQDMSADPERAREHLADLASWYRDAMILASGGREVSLINSDKAEALAQRVDRVNPEAWQDRLESVLEAEAALAANANLKLNLEALLVRLTPGLAAENR